MEVSNSIYYRVMGTKLRASVLKFPGGEIHVRLPGDSLVDVSKRTIFQPGTVSVVARLRSSDDIMELLLTTEVLRTRYIDAKFKLYMDYIPYARQDRRCLSNEAFSLKVFCNLINSMDYDLIFTKDAHSDVAPALLNNCHNIPVDEILADREFVSGRMLVSPDAGANKKVQAVAKRYNNVNIIRADKVRDISTGEIIETKVYADDLSGIHCLIIDDICDGGRTFYELAKVLKEEHNAARVELFVTHGIFSQGFERLMEYVDHIYTTLSFYQPEDNSGYITVIK